MAAEHAVRSLILKVRVDPNERRDLEDAASRAGQSLSTWIRSVALRAAAQTERNATQSEARRVRARRRGR